MNKLLDIIKNTKEVVFIAGENKNAGKTTFLNYILKHVRGKLSLAFLTIGIDGETKDQIYGTPKPRIFTVTNDYLVSTSQAIENSFATFEIVDSFPFETTMGRIVLAKTLRSGYIELIGPETNDQLGSIIDYLYKMKIEHIYIDGAVNRITQVASFKNSSFFYVTKIHFGNLSTNINRLKAIYKLLNLPKVGSKILKDNNTYILKGAVTPSKIMDIPKNCKTIVFEDLTKVFLDYNIIINLTKEYNIYINNHYKLLGFIVNLYDVDRNYFEEMIGDNDLLDFIYYNPYER